MNDGVTTRATHPFVNDNREIATSCNLAAYLSSRLAFYAEKNMEYGMGDKGDSMLEDKKPRNSNA